MSSLLAVSWAMPPVLFPRALQVSRTLHELSRRGWASTVITAQPTGEGAGAASTVEDRALAEYYRESYRLVPVEAREHVAPSGRVLRTVRRWRKVEDDVIDADNWERRAFAAAMDLLRRKRFHALVTFAQPWSDHRIGLAIRRRMPTLPWVAHFSDPWSDNPYYQNSSQKQLAEWRAQEAAVVKAADRLVFVTERTASMVMSKYDPALAHKAVVVPHGFDEALLEAARTRPAESRPTADSPLRIVYSGNLYPGVREPRVLLDAVSEIAGRRGLRGRLRLEFVGYQPPEFREYAATLELDGVVEFRAQVSSLDSLAYTRGADVLLLIDASFEHSVFLPSKLSDYLLVDKPIVGLTPDDSESAEVLRSLGYPVVDPGDRRGICDLLDAMLDNGLPARANASTDASSIRATFDIENTTTRFEWALRGAQERHFEELIKEPGWHQPLRAPMPTSSLATTLGAEPGGGNARFSKAEVKAQDHFSRTAARMIDRIGCSATIAVAGEIAPGGAEELLAIAGVSSIVLPNHDSGLPARWAERVGWFERDGTRWRLPSVLSREMLFLGEPGELGVMMTTSAFRRGVRRLSFASEVGLTRHSTFRLIVENTLRSIAWRARSSLRRALAPLPLRQAPVQYLDGLNEAGNARRLRKLLESRLPAPLDPGNVVPGRVLLVTGTLGPGGAERQFTYTIRALQAAGVDDIIVLCESLAGEVNAFHLDSLRRLGVEVRSLKSRAAYTARCMEDVATWVMVSKLLTASPQLAQQFMPHLMEIIELRPACVHTWQDGVNVRAGIAALIAGVPKLVLSCRSFAPVNFDLYSPLMRPAYLELLRHPHVVMLNNSLAGARDYGRWLGVELERMQVVRNAVDQAEFNRHEPGEPVRDDWAEVLQGAPVVGGVLRFSEEKRPQLWLETAAAVARKREDIRFLLVGDGTQNEEIRRRAGELGLSGRIVLPGYQSKAWKLLKSMDLVLLTSRLEGLPNVLLEAQSLGVPVVSTSVGGVPEAIRDGVTGIAVASDSPEVLADRILECLSDTRWMRTAAEEGPKFVAEEFSIERMGRETLTAYGMMPASSEGARQEQKGAR